MNLIQKHNLEADMGGHTYWLGMNKYGDLVKEIIFLKVLCFS